MVLHLQAVDRYERVDGVASFVGEDASGSFGILPHHDRFMTFLTFGLARYRRADGPWEYLALPGGLLYAVDNALYVNARRYLRDLDAQRIAEALAGELLAEEQALAEMKEKVRRLEEDLLRRLLAAARER